METRGGVGDLVRAAAAGDRRAWDELVDRYSRLLWSIAIAYRLGRADAADVREFDWVSEKYAPGNDGSAPTPKAA